MLDAAEAELVEHGIAGFTVRGVADRAGCSTATLYRRWSGHGTAGRPQVRSAEATGIHEQLLAGLAERRVGLAARRFHGVAGQATLLATEPSVEVPAIVLGELLDPTIVELTRAAVGHPSIVGHLEDFGRRRLALLGTLPLPPGRPDLPPLIDLALLGLAHPVVALGAPTPPPPRHRELVAPIAAWLVAEIRRRPHLDPD